MDNRDINQLVSQTVKTKGWHFIRQWLTDKRTAFNVQLIKASDLDTIRRLQGQIHFIDTFLAKVEEMARET